MHCSLLGDERTSSQLLMQALEDFSDSEARGVVILWTNEAGDLCIMSNSTNSQALGLCEYGKQSILKKIFRGDE